MRIEAAHEHPRASAIDPAPLGPDCGSQHCITCGDDGDPMLVVRVDAERGLALCEAEDGSAGTVEIALVEPVAAGERLLVHAGTAIARLDAEPAS